MQAEPTSSAQGGEIDVSIVVVSYGTRDLTSACLDSVVRETRKVTYEVVVVDNASPDDSATVLARAFPAFHHLPQTKNLGFGAACNLAARVSRGRYILLLNPDTVVLDGAINKIVDFARRRPRARVWGGRTVYEDGRLNAGSCWRQLSTWNLFCQAVGLSTLFPNSALLNSHAYGGWRRDDERIVEVVTGCFLLMERELWNQLGGFSPEFFMYGEDEDLCLRARQLGAVPTITPEAVIVHAGSGTESDNARKAKRMLAAKSLLIRKYFPRFEAPMARGMLTLHAIIRASFGSVRTRQVWASVWQGRELWLKGRFET